MTDIEWRAIPGWEGRYEVSNHGSVRSLDRVGTGRDGRLMDHRGRLLRPGPDGRGYLMVSLKREGKRTPMRVHRAVLLAFHGPRPPRADGRHLNGDRRDNRSVNLAWGTRSENAYDTVRHGRNEKAQRAACPLDHELRPPNLTAESQRRRNRDCLACHRASGNAAYAKRKGRPFDFVAAAHRHYRLIMGDQARPGAAHVTRSAQRPSRADAGLSRVGAAPTAAPDGRAE